MRRHGRRRPGTWQVAIEVGHRLPRIAVEHVEDRDRGDEAVVIAAPDRRIEEEMARLLEARERLQVAHAPFDVRMAGLPEVDLDAVGRERRVGQEQAGRLHVDDEGRIRRAASTRSRASMTPILSAKISWPSLSTTPQRSPSPSKPSARSAPLSPHRLRHRVQHMQVFGVRIVAGEGEVELAVERNDVDAERGEELRREGARRAVAAGGDDLELAPELRTAGQVGDVAGGKIGHELVAAARLRRIVAPDDDVAQPRHLLRTEGDGPRRAHLHSGPAVVVVRGRHHRDCRNVKRELREIGHRREREADVAHPRPARHQARDERELDRGRIAAEVVADDDLALNPKLLQEMREPEPERLGAHEVDFLLEKPARVIFAKAGRLHDRQGFVSVSIGRKIGMRLRKQQRSRRRRARDGHVAGAGGDVGLAERLPRDKPDERASRAAGMDAKPMSSQLPAASSKRLGAVLRV